MICHDLFSSKQQKQQQKQNNIIILTPGFHWDFK